MSGAALMALGRSTHWKTSASALFCPPSQAAYALFRPGCDTPAGPSLPQGPRLPVSKPPLIRRSGQPAGTVGVGVGVGVRVGVPVVVLVDVGLEVRVDVGVAVSMGVGVAVAVRVDVA